MFRIVSTILIPAMAFFGLAQPIQVQAQTEPPLIVGFADFPPYMQRSEDGTLSGFIVGLAEAIGDELGLEIDYLISDSARTFVAAQATGESQMIPGIALLPPLRDSNVFSDPVATESLRLIARTGDISRLSGSPPSGVRIGIIPPAVGSDFEALLSANTAVEFASPEAAIMELISGDLDAVLVPNPTAYDIARRAGVDHRVGFVTPAIRRFDRYVALHESRADLLPRINEAIARMQADGRLEALRRTYFLDLPEPTPDVLTVGIAHSPPYGIIAEDGSVSGFAAELFADLAERAGLQYRFETLSLEKYFATPFNQGIDVLPALIGSPDLQEVMDLTLPVLAQPISAFVRTDDPSESFEDLIGRSVAMKVDIQSYAMEAGLADDDVVVINDDRELIRALVNGNVDAIVEVPEVVNAVIAAEDIGEAVRLLQDNALQSETVLGLRIGLGDVRERLNAVVPGYLSSEDYAALRARYIEEPVFWTQRRIQIFGGLTGVLILSLLSLAGYLQHRTRARAAAERDRQSAEVASIRDELEIVFNAATSGIVALDGHGKVVRVNRRARHMLGGISDETPFDWPQQSRFVDAETLTPLEASADPIRRALLGHRLKGETHLLRRGKAADEPRYVRVDSASLDSKENGIAVVLVFDDVSTEERNRQVVERKSRLDALGQLTGGIAHDFNNLLASLLYAVDLARRAKDPEKRLTYLDLASSSIGRGRDLTTRLLSFAKRQPGRSESRDIAGVFTDFEQLIRPMIEAKYDITYQSSAANLQVYCDQTQLETALMNLVLNSRDAMMRAGRGNRIDLKARPVRSTAEDLDGRQTGTETETDTETLLRGGSTFRYVEVSVTDNGPGMDEDVLARATDPFFTTKDSNSGTGLGLSMVYGFARQSDGDLRIYSEKGVGTTVQLTLPRGTVMGLREQPMPKEVPMAGQGQTILMVEDEVDLIKVMTAVVEDLGYAVITAKSGQEALDIVASGARLDLVLTDVVMPGKIGGFELAKRVRARQPDLPIIYTSGYTGFTASEMGDVQAPLLQKPAPPEDLAEAIAKALGNAPSGQT